MSTGKGPRTQAETLTPYVSCWGKERKEHGGSHRRAVNAFSGEGPVKAKARRRVNTSRARETQLLQAIADQAECVEALRISESERDRRAHWGFLGWQRWKLDAMERKLEQLLAAKRRHARQDD
jgi:hypothetical protein